MNISDLPRDGHFYLASPYTRYEGGIWPAYKEAARIAGQLVKEGIDVYSPIAHAHPLAIYGGIDPLDHKLWMRVDAPYVARATHLLVATMPGWRESKGVAAEIFEFGKRGKPAWLLDPETFELSPMLFEMEGALG